MGMFADVRVDTNIDLPHYPEGIEQKEMWQSKRGLDVYGEMYRLTADGRLEQLEFTVRGKTEQERQEEAEKWGFDSWDSFVAAYDNDDPNDEGYSLFPEEIDYDIEEELPPIYPSETKTDREWWEDQNFHGSFEIHGILREPELFLQYDVHFEYGDMTDIVFKGERGNVANPNKSALEKIENWNESQ